MEGAILLGLMGVGYFMNKDKDKNSSSSGGECEGNQSSNERQQKYQPEFRGKTRTYDMIIDSKLNVSYEGWKMLTQTYSRADFGLCIDKTISARERKGGLGNDFKYLRKLIDDSDKENGKRPSRAGGQTQQEIDDDIYENAG